VVWRWILSHLAAFLVNAAAFRLHDVNISAGVIEQGEPMQKWLCWVVLSVWMGLALAQAEGPALLLAQVYEGEGEGEGKLDLPGYWVSEKYDGVRAYWDGRQLRFRSGRVVAAPAWLTAALPNQPLDGELWLGRGQFQKLLGIVRKEQPVDAEWRQVRYMLFELPGGAGSFTMRLEALRGIAHRIGQPWLQVAPQFRVADAVALKKRLREVLAGGGEGLMLHRADAPYVTGRSEVLLKVTPERDAEATVIGHLPGKGRFAGMLGALQVKTPEGRVFRIGSGFSHAERRQPPPLGSVITYRYRELSRDGVPRFARYLRRYQPL